MDFEEIKKLISEGKYLFSKHAGEERTKDNLLIGEVVEAVLAGEVIEERPDDARGESRLVAGKTKNGKSIHTVIGQREGKPLFVTVYKPEHKLWIRGKIRKRGK